MGLLQDIQNATIDADRPLAAVLRMAKVLAARLDNHVLMEWVDHELNGYPDDAILPPYRAERLVHVLGNFSGPFGAHFTNQPIPPLAIPEKHRDSYLFRFRFVDAVAAYEEMLRSREGDLQAPWPADVLIVLRPRVFQGMECVRAWRVIPRGDFVGVLDGVRNRLLDLVLQLEREVPEAGDVPAAKLLVSSEQVTQIVTKHDLREGNHRDRQFCACAGHGRQHHRWAGQPRPAGRCLHHPARR
jgi:hypothetical protein